MLNLKMFTDRDHVAFTNWYCTCSSWGFFQELLKAVNPEGDGYITIDEFYSAMKRPGVVDG